MSNEYKLKKTNYGYLTHSRGIRADIPILDAHHLYQGGIFSGCGWGGNAGGQEMGNLPTARQPRTARADVALALEVLRAIRVG